MICPHCGNSFSTRGLDTEMVRIIREDGDRVVDLAKALNVSRQTIWRIRAGRTHKPKKQKPR